MVYFDEVSLLFAQFCSGKSGRIGITVELECLLLLNEYSIYIPIWNFKIKTKSA